MASNSTIHKKELAKEIPSHIRLYKDGSVERLLGSPIVPPSLDDPDTAVSSKDITISNNPLISARIYLPAATLRHNNNQKLPVLVYFHGGAFCLESAFSFLDHRYLNQIVSQSSAIAISVEYRLAPEHPIPAAYEDCWAALQWAASHSTPNPNNKEPWLIDHGDFTRVFIGGDSAGGNIVHNMAMRAGVESLVGGVKILGAFLGHPFFWGSKPTGLEPKEGHEKRIESLAWEFVSDGAQGGVDNPMINPMSAGAPSLAALGCEKMLVCVAGKDRLRERGVWYFNGVRESGWRGKIEIVEMEEEDHCFHILQIESDDAKILIKRLASFLSEE